MALNTAAEVRAVGGIDHADDHNLFRVANSAALDTMITNLLPISVAWLAARAPLYYTGTAPGPHSTQTDALFKLGEALLTLHWLTLRLKSRKVFGTHWAVDSETSDRYEELIDVEYMRQVEQLLEGFIIIEVDGGAGGAFAAPSLIITDEIDPDTVTVITDQLQEDLDIANGLIGVGVLH